MWGQRAAVLHHSLLQQLSRFPVQTGLLLFWPVGVHVPAETKSWPMRWGAESTECTARSFPKTSQLVQIPPVSTEWLHEAVPGSPSHSRSHSSHPVLYHGFFLLSSTKLHPRRHHPYSAGPPLHKITGSKPAGDVSIQADALSGVSFLC